MKKNFKKICLLLKRNKSLDDFVWLYNHTKSEKIKKNLYEKAIRDISLKATTCSSKEDAKENMLIFIKLSKNLTELSSFEVIAGYWGRKIASFS